VERIKKKINDCVLEIIELTGYEVAFDGNMKLVDSLGLSSLDLTKLVASLEVELEVDPFSNGTSIFSISTLNDLYDVYSKCIK
jgi:acyl carrier protein